RFRVFGGPGMKKSTWIGLAVLLIGAALSAAFFWPFSRNHKELVLPGAVEVFEVRLGSKVGGRVGPGLVRAGREVAANTELVRFEAPELRAQIEQTEAKLASAKANLLKAENGSRPQEIDEAKAQADAAAARNQKMIAGWREEEKKQARFDKDTTESDL